MSSDTDLPRRPNTLQQQPPRSFKPRIWKVIFILLLIAHLVVGGWVFWLICYLLWGYSGMQSGKGVGLLAAIYPILILSIIDLIALLSYVFIRRSQRKEQRL
jgi:hypothetical protein